MATYDEKLKKIFREEYPTEPEKAERLYNATMALKRITNKHSERMGTCPCCEQPIKQKKVSYNHEAIRAMYQVYLWCEKKERHVFETSEIKHLLGKTEYANIGHWIKFAGIFYKPADKKTGKSRKGLWGINMDRAEDFFSGKIQAPVQIIKDRFTDEIIERTDRYVYEFPHIKEFLDENRLYDNNKIMTGTKVEVRETEQATLLD